MTWYEYEDSHHGCYSCPFFGYFYKPYGSPIWMWWGLLQDNRTVCLHEIFLIHVAPRCVYRKRWNLLKLLIYSSIYLSFCLSTCLIMCSVLRCIPLRCATRLTLQSWMAYSVDVNIDYGDKRKTRVKACTYVYSASVVRRCVCIYWPTWYGRHLISTQKYRIMEYRLGFAVRHLTII